MRTLALALAAAFVLPLYFTGTALAALGVVDWEYSFVNMRSAPSTGAKKLLRIPEGTELEIVEDKGEWLLIGHAGKQGWVVSRSVQLLKPSTVGALAPVEEESVKAPALQAAAPELILAETSIEAAVAPRPADTGSPVRTENVANPSVASGVASGADARYPSNAGNAQEIPNVDAGMNLADIFLWLFAALGAIGGVAWAVRRFSTGQLSQVQGDSAIRVLSSLPLSTRQVLLLVEVGGEAYLLAQSEGGVDLLTKIESPEALERLDRLLKFKAKPLETVDADNKGLKRQGCFEDTGSDGDSVGGSLGDEKDVSPEERLKMLRRRPTHPEHKP